MAALGRARVSCLGLLVAMATLASTPSIASAQGDPADINNITPVEGTGVARATGQWSPPNGDYTAIMTTTFTPAHIQPGEPFTFESSMNIVDEFPSGGTCHNTVGTSHVFWRVAPNTTLWNTPPPPPPLESSVSVSGNNVTTTCPEPDLYEQTFTAPAGPTEPGCYQQGAPNYGLWFPGQFTNSGTIGTLRVGNGPSCGGVRLRVTKPGEEEEPEERGVVTGDGGIDCGQVCTALYDLNDEVELTAAANPGFVFDHWEGDCAGTDPSCDLTMDVEKNVEAIFLPEGVVLDITVHGPGQVAGCVDQTPKPPACRQVYAPGDTASLTAEGFLDHWEGACSGSSPSCSIVMNQNRQVSAFFTPGTFSWSMPERYNGEDRDGSGLADYFTPLNYLFWRPTATDQPDEIHPPSWEVDLHAEQCPPDAVVQWLVNGSPRGGGCDATVALPELAPDDPAYQVSIVVNGAIGETESVRPKDWLIAAIGDSYGSGEGNPDVPWKRHRGPQDEEPSRWEEKPCHRSAAAAAPQAAQVVERADPQSSVTLVHLSCSGATIPVGLIGPYAGSPPDADPGNPQPPQTQELTRLTGPRTPDALLISVGGNDIGFSDIITECLLNDGCQKKKSKARKIFRKGMKGLTGLYSDLELALRGIVPDARVAVTAYPDPTRYDDGKFCGKGDRPLLLAESPVVPPKKIDAKEAKWASETVLKKLNQRLGEIAALNGWSFISRHVTASRTHGDCAKDSWFVSWDTAKERQEIYPFKEIKGFGVVYASNGIVHPNEAGQIGYRDAILPILGGLGMPVG